jgi:predicted MFS family arabinose efflux permease
VIAVSAALAAIGGAIGLLALALAAALPEVLLAGVLYAAGNAVGTATTLALAIQRARPERRGRAMASFSVAYPLSAGAGALWSGSVAELAGYSGMYATAAAMAAVGLLLALLRSPRIREV